MKQTLDALACVERCYILYLHIRMCASLTLIMSALELSSRLLRRREATCLDLVSGLTPALSARLHTHNRTHNTLTSQHAYTCRSIPGRYINTHPSELCAVCVWGGCSVCAVWVWVCVQCGCGGVCMGVHTKD